MLGFPKRPDPEGNVASGALGTNNWLWATSEQFHAAQLMPSARTCSTPAARAVVGGAPSTQEPR
jgi:hypothetical protein